MTLTPPSSTKKRTIASTSTTRVIEVSSAEEFLRREASIDANGGVYGLAKGVKRRIFAQDLADVQRARAVAAAADLAGRMAAARAATSVTHATDAESMYIGFMQMGQGDCIVVKTPGGRVMIIDCGSTSKNDAIAAGTAVNEVTIDEDWSDGGLEDAVATSMTANPPVDLLAKARASLRQPCLLGNSCTKVDYLILTHCDTDHYNKLKQLLGKFITEFGEVYHSNDLALYSADKVSDFIRSKVTSPDDIRRVTLNDPAGTTAMLTSQSGLIVDADLDANGGYLFVDEDNCKIWLLAGDVTAAQLGVGRIDGDATETNQRSLVVLIEAFGEKKILLCGDACRSTEHYVVGRCRDAIKNVDLLQVPHHGSDTTSSSDQFIRATNPRAVIASAARKDNQHHHPQMLTVSAYYRQMKRSMFKTLSAPHFVSYWSRGERDSQLYCLSQVNRPVYTTGSQGTFIWQVYRDDDDEVIIKNVTI